MLRNTVARVLGLFALLPVTLAASSGTTTTTWDCCKPACGYTQNAQAGGAHGVANTCSISNQVLSNGASASNACIDAGGIGYSCSSYQPIIVNSTLSYGFAGNWETSNCGKCFKFTWTSGAGTGKSMIVQVINSGGVNTGDFDIYTPGGGVGDYNACTSQYGAPSTGWGNQYGGVSSDSQCAQLPSNLQAGCHWRFEWAGGTINGWTTTYSQVSCPSQLSGISGFYA